RTTVQRGELLAVELKRYGHDRSLRTRSCITIPSGVQNLRVFENGDIEIRCFFRVIVKPQEGGNFLRAWLSAFVSCRRSPRLNCVRCHSNFSFCLWLPFGLIAAASPFATPTECCRPDP